MALPFDKARTPGEWCNTVGSEHLRSGCATGKDREPGRCKRVLIHPGENCLLAVTL